MKMENRKSLPALKGRGFLVSLLASFVIPILSGAPAAAPFTVPEKLQYNLTWAGIKAGEAVLETRKDGRDIECISKVNSAKWVSVFYRVEDIVTSRIRNDRPRENFVGTPYHYRIKMREGGHRRDKEFILDHAAKKATYINYRKKEKIELPISESALDPLSTFYYIRTVPLVVGKPVYVDVFDTKQLYRTEIQVLRKEVVEIPLGTFNTILVRPVIKSEGIFHRKGDLFIWITDDDKRLPVQLKTKAAIGSIKAVLAGGQY